MRLLRLVLVIGLTVSLLGCKSWRKKEGLGRLGEQEASKRNAENQEFERIKDPPITADTYAAAGQLAESQERFGDAIQQYQAALKANPNHTVALFRLGTLYTSQKMFAEATEIWKQYVKATNGSAASYNNLGYCYDKAGQHKDAESAYRKGIEKDAKDQHVRVNFGLMLARLGRIKEAGEQLGAVLKPAEVHYNLGSVYEQQGKKDQAKAAYQKALLLDANLHDAKARLAALK